jgi:hypothetical protein
LRENWRVGGFEIDAFMVMENRRVLFYMPGNFSSMPQILACLYPRLQRLQQRRRFANRHPHR